MAGLILDRDKTGLLMADFATSGIGQNPVAQERHTLERAGEVLDASRNAGVFVCYCVSHFRPGFPEVSDRNLTGPLEGTLEKCCPQILRSSSTHR